MSIAVVCPTCAAKTTVADKAAGSRVKCPRCSHPVVVPDPEPPLAEIVDSADDRPRPGRERPLPLARRPATKPRPRPQDDREDEEDEDDRDRPAPEKSSGFKYALPFIAIAGGTLLLVGLCGGGGYYLFRNVGDGTQKAVLVKVDEGKIAPPVEPDPEPVWPNEKPIQTNPLTPRPAPTPANVRPAPVPTPAPPQVGRTVALQDAKPGRFADPFAGFTFVSPCGLAPDGVGGVERRWSGRFGQPSGSKTDQFHLSVRPHSGSIPATPDAFIALLAGDCEYSAHRNDPQISKTVAPLGGKPCLVLKLRQEGGSANEQEFNTFYAVTDGKKLVVLDFKTFGADVPDEFVKGIVESFRFLP